MMRVVLTVISVLLLTSHLVYVSGAGAVGDPCCDDNQCSTQQPCNTGLTCCYERPQWMESIGGTCMDPTVSVCASCPVYNPNHPDTKVCPTTAPTCCGECIDNTQQCCHHYLSYDYFQCAADQTCCGFGTNGTASHTCCDSTQSCVNDVCVTTPTCQSGDLLCGTSCYLSSQYVCADPSRGFLCPVATPLLCGSNECYNSAQYTCDNGQLIPVNPGGTVGPTSGGGATQGPTQPPTQAPTSGPTTVATPAPGCVNPGDEMCGTACYSPATYVCANPASSFLCPVAQPSLCGTNACYSTSQYTCVNGQLLIGANATPAPSAAPGCVMPGDEKCGDQCYSPVTHVCTNPATSFLCPVAYPNLCGANACYSTSQYTCVNGSLQPV
jgi:hypothetical protein